MIETEWVMTCDGCGKKEVGDSDNDGLLADWYAMEIEHDFTRNTAHACKKTCIKKAVTNVYETKGA